jgi:BMFP domain-containing protein YqiC
MSKSNLLIDDLLTLGSSLFGNLFEARHELKAQARNRMDDFARRLDLVSREEFDAAFAMLAKARSAQEELRERVERIEAKLNLSRAGKKKNAAGARLRSVKQGNRRAKRK